MDDPVASLFGLDSAAGALTTWADRPFLFRGVTANVADPLGTYGLALTALGEAEALKPGESGVVPWLTPTLAAAAGSRTNVAVPLLEPGTEALVTIVDDAGLVRGEKRLAAANALFWQQPVTEFASDAEIPLGRVEVRVLRGAALAYVAVVDDVTGDGVLALARRVETPAVPPDAVLLPGAARTSGANGSLWRTGLRIVTPGTDAVEVTLEVPGGSARAPRFVPPRGTLEESDLLAALGYEEGNAAPVRVLAFTSLSAGSGTSGFRTIVAFVGGPAGASGRLLLRASSGEQLAEAGLEAGPSSWTQKPLSDWLGAVAVPRDARLEVTVDSGSLDACASVIDNGTGDPVILPPAFLPSAQCPPAGPAPLLSASSSRVEAGTSVALRLEAPVRVTGRVVPGDLPLGPGGSLFVVPAVTTAHRWIPSSPFSEDRSAPSTTGSPRSDGSPGTFSPPRRAGASRGTTGPSISSQPSAG